MEGFFFKKKGLFFFVRESSFNVFCVQERFGVCVVSVSQFEGVVCVDAQTCLSVRHSLSESPSLRVGQSGWTTSSIAQRMLKTADKDQEGKIQRSLKNMLTFA